MYKWLTSYLITLSLFFQCRAEELRHKGFFVDASVLYWRAQEGGLSYAVKSPANNRLAPHAKIENPEFDWDFGFKVGFGYRIPHDRWQLELLFASLQTHTDADKKTTGEDVFFPLWLKPTSTSSFVDQVTMHWRLHLGLLDALLFKPFQATSTLTLVPQIGIRNGWIRQKFNLSYFSGNLPQGDDELIRMKNKYWGIGPKVGLSGEGKIACGLSLFAQGAFSLLFGEFYLHQDEDTLGSKEKLLGIHNIFHASAPILEASAGFNWKHIYSRSKRQLKLQLAWNQLVFFSQNQLMRFLDANVAGQFVSNQGDLSLAGIELGIHFDF